MSKKEKARTAGKALLHMDHKAHAAAEETHASGLVKVVGALSEIGDQPQLRLLCGGTMALGLLRGDPRMLGAGLRMLLAHEVATVDRKRPHSADGKHEEKPRPGRHTDKEHNSFPSGHSAGATAVAVAFSAVYPEHRAAATLAAGAVAVAQVPRCAHYPTDVGAGIAIGALAASAVGQAWRLGRLALLRIMR
jgi:membrane-associated phospholipid phosphatase